MKDMINYKVVILDKNGKYGLYTNERCLSSIECITEYSRSHFGRSMSLQSFVKNGNIVFMNNHCFVDAYMPKKISDEQLYELDLLSVKMSGIKRMKIQKLEEEEFIIDDRIEERFSGEVIQSYFNKPKQKKK